jgi:hypothetical protein
MSGRAGATRALKRLTAARLAGVPELEESFSDLTDTKDIWDGGGEAPPSSGRHVRILQESLLEMGYELPKHGVDGRYGVETTAAVLQFQIDAGHPLPVGHEWEHVLGIAGPNTLAHFDMFAPGGTIGDAARPPSGVAARAVRFLESPDHPLAGFDETTSPSSLVVGVSTRRRVRVDIEPPGADVTFEAEDPAIATIGHTHDGIVVGGEQVGVTLVRAMSHGVVEAELLVSVKDMREVSVHFFYVSDASAEPFATSRDHEKATLLTLRLNRVLRRQANVRFSLNGVTDLVLPESIGPVFERKHIDLLAPFAVPFGALNVFCVLRVAEGVEPVRVPDGLDGAAIVVLPDHDCPDGMDVMHGTAHCLGYPLTDAASGLMAACGTATDRRRVPREVADLVNPTGVA